MEKNTCTNTKEYDQSEKIFAYEQMMKELSKNPNSSNQLKMLKMQKYFNGRMGDSGWFGRITEIFSHTVKSRKSWVALQGRDDSHIKFKKNGKIQYLPIEVKTNGGRISSLYERNAPKFIVYSLNINNSLTKEPRIVEPVIMRTQDFLQLLTECNAIKNTNGTNPELAIQAISKKLYIRLLEYPISYDRDAIYTEYDFEGIEI